MEYEDSHGDAQDDFVFDDDNLTWGEVARATGADEPSLILELELKQAQA